jgi:hypothetical protein
MRDDQNTNATFSGAHPPGLTIKSGEIFEVQTLDASGGHITRDGPSSRFRPPETVAGAQAIRFSVEL